MKIRIGTQDEDRSFLDVDLDNLEDEWCKQPRLFHEYAAKLADAKRALDYAKTDLEVFEAELTLKVRADPAGYEFKKPPTEKTLESFIRTRKKHKELRREITDAQYKVNIIQAAVSALDTKKKALENAVDLHGMDYFATPRPKKGSEEKIKRMEQRKART